ncbi:MAG: hypothetical protein ACE361_04040 [Aureliella sp.]
MLVFATRYAKVQAILFACMVAYMLIVVPMIEPAERVAKDIPEHINELPSEFWWQAFFPADSWQTQSPNIINTKQGILLCKSWTPIDEKTWDLEKLTMILPQSDSGQGATVRERSAKLTDRDMWVIIAEEGATIHFDEPPGPDTSTKPTIALGELKGRIEITKKAANARPVKDPWRLTTSDLTINRTQVVTQQQVTIDWGDSIIQGRNLLIRLRSDLLGGDSSSKSPWGPLDQLELYHVEKVDIALPPGGIWADLDAEQFATDSRVSGAELKAMPARLQAICGGRFAFDFGRSLATLLNGVRIEHRLGDLTPDIFNCEKVTIAVEPPEDEVSGRMRPIDGSKSEAEIAGIKIKSLDAVGADSLADYVGERWVEVRAPTVDVVSRSKTLVIDIDKRRIEFGGQLNKPSAEKSNAMVSYQGNEFISPRIEYQTPPESEAGEPTHLGWLVAQGPGEFFADESDDLKNSAASSGDHAIKITWEKLLRMAPNTASASPSTSTSASSGQRDPDTQWLELLGNATIDSNEHGYVQSNRIEVWMRRNEAGIAHSTENDEVAWNPKRVYSPNATSIRTPDIHADVTQLDLEIETRVEPRLRSPQASSEKESSLALSDAEGNPMYQWIGPPKTAGGAATGMPGFAEQQVAVDANGRTVPGQQSGDRDTQEESKIPLKVTGTKLAGRIIRTKSESWVDSLNIDGPVRMSREIVTKSGLQPWSVDGSTLVLTTNLLGETDLQVEGKPATMKLADGLVTSEAIRFDQTRNMVEIDHPGEFKAPYSMLISQDQGHDSRLGKVEWLRAPICRWKERLRFDGKVLRLQGGIEFDAAFRTSPEQMLLTAGTADELHVHFSEPIDFRNARANEASVESRVDRIVLDQNVNIMSSQLDGDRRSPTFGDKKSRDQILVPRLTFYVQEERVVGQGRGVLMSRFLSDRKPGQLASSTSGETASEELQGAYVTFRDELVGLLDREELVLDGKIEVLTGPIKSWDDAILPNEQAQIEDGQLLLNCDQLRIYETQGLSTSSGSSSLISQRGADGTWEFKAMGNVAFNGESDSGTYSGSGYELSYAKATNWLKLAGQGRDAAYIRSVPHDGSRGEFEAYIEQVYINPDTFETADLKFAEGGFRGQLGGTEPGSPTNQLQDGNWQRPAASGSDYDPRRDSMKDFFNRDKRP